jgi:hypothetical protein
VVVGVADDLYLAPYLQFFYALTGGTGMGKGSQHDFVALAMLVVAGLALAAACLGAFGSLGA